MSPYKTQVGGRQSNWTKVENQKEDPDIVKVVKICSILGRGRFLNRNEFFEEFMRAAGEASRPIEPGLITNRITPPPEISHLRPADRSRYNVVRGPHPIHPAQDGQDRDAQNHDAQGGEPAEEDDDYYPYADGDEQGDEPDDGDEDPERNDLEDFMLPEF